ncbi:MAG: glycoside hydrolase family 2 protein, partial [Lachnospiraceae bacterium]|nr:glycoside hydrolase family 2 protein [Lachnospiraceae bacterium]
MRAQKWNENWMFWEDKDSFALVWNVPETARKVTLPHDAMLERRVYAGSPNMGNTGFRDGGIYCYVKNLYVPEDAREKLLMLKFEGVYMNAMVYVNSQLAGKNMFGYTTFYVPLNDLVKYGEENEIRVQVRNSGMTNSRWYSGSG